ncbi:phosphotransferase family protein [Actinospongicola halichondriae]|uniref:phosphotransferase family protein n=1 Tax=Actinospongicola halichondriae TaxID=3236844 RepID=UPI003D50C513
MEKIGEGGEAEVFALDADRVLRRWRRDHPSIGARIGFTQEVAAGASDLDFAVPKILDHHVDEEGRPCFVERRLPGRSMTEALDSVTGAQRTALLTSYLETACALREIAFDRPWFGEVIAEPPLRSETWRGYLEAALDRQVAAADADAYPSVDIEALADSLREEIAAADEPVPSLLHFDYFPGNVLCDDTRITAVIDWSVLSIVGDPDLDVALAVAYFAVTPTAAADDISFSWSWLRDRGLADRARFHERWGAAWWLPHSEDENIRSFVAGVLDPPRRAES